MTTRSDPGRGVTGRDLRPVDPRSEWCQPDGMNTRRRWADLGPTARTGIVVAGVAQFGLLGAALVDISRRRPDQIQGPRWAWVMASFVNFVGPLAYFAVGRRRAPR